MPKTGLLTAACVAAVFAALGFTACGGDDDNGGSSADEDQITQAVDAVATSGDPGACTQYQTAAFTQQVNGEPGQSVAEALKSCQEDAENTVAGSVEVNDIEVDGDSATAAAKVTGSTFDGQTLDIALVKEGDQWKLDKFNGFVDLDRDALESSFTEDISSDPSIPPAGADCINQQVQGLSDEELEGFFTGESGEQAAQEIFGPCDKFFQGG